MNYRTISVQPVGGGDYIVDLQTLPNWFDKLMGDGQHRVTLVGSGSSWHFGDGLSRCDSYGLIRACCDAVRAHWLSKNMQYGK